MSDCASGRRFPRSLVDCEDVLVSDDSFPILYWNCCNLYDQCLCAWSKAKCGFFCGSAGTFVWRFYELCQPV